MFKILKKYSRFNNYKNTSRFKFYKIKIFSNV